MKTDEYSNLKNILLKFNMYKTNSWGLSMVNMENEIKTEFLKVKDLISEEEFLNNCEKLHHRIGLSRINHSKIEKPYNGQLYFHDKNDFPIKDLYNTIVGIYPLNDCDISKILTASILSGIDLIDDNCDYAIIYNHENNVEFIKKDEMYDEKLINRFHEELLDYTLDYCKKGLILKELGKSINDFNSIEDLFNFLNNIKDRFPSLNLSLKYYNNFKDDFNTVKEFYTTVVEFDYCYKYTENEIPTCDPFFDELMDQYYDLYKPYHDSYDYWDQYGPSSYHL